ncbi:ammonium transporter [Epibacterium sp. Ofav1-8]|uniref:ammonium transporter n=1 Tax=Epibacterium sp. Ofav1-8 TaxID=2917735 RepID=UPI001EF43ECD|nr:ammonium transporter [Epibacterium sp. Ofav1-8]
MQQDALHAVQQLQLAADHMWTLIAAALVLLMQLGFLLVEAGMARSKNSINVAQKNITDFLMSVSAFYVLGFGLMFGASYGGWFGTDTFAFEQADDWQYTFFVFQAVFAGTAATIMSGAVAERMRYGVYVAAALFIGLLIYPVSGHWAWGNLLNGDNAAYLADRGFIDFAGSTVVHSVGAWVALAGIVVLGARIGKFNADGSPNVLHGHSYVLATAGAIILWVGWIGFNGGSTTAASPDLAHIVLNTLLAACFGGVMGILTGRVIDPVNIPHRPINGSLAGLVAITAGCDAVSVQGAAVIGASAGLLVVVSEWVMENKLKLDDVVGAVSVHGVCGAFGTVVFPLFALPGKLAAGSVGAQVLVQMEGVVLVFAWAFGLSWVFFKAIDMAVGIRVPREDEMIGLNSTEHGATLGTGGLQKQIEAMTENGVDLTRRLDASTGDEAAELAALFNPFIDQVHDLVCDIHENARRMKRSSSGLETLSGAFREGAERTGALTGLVSNSSTEVAGQARNNREIAEQILAEMTRIASSAEGMSEEVTAVSEAIAEMMNSISQISGNASATSGVTKEANVLSGEAVETMQALSKASEEIEAVVGLIQKITMQTNMLAINAAVEAARAGDAGKGFAIVAGQVRSLAAETDKAAEEIRQRISHMRSQSDDASSVIGGITELMQSIHASVEGITAEVESQRRAAGRVSERMTSASNSAQTVTQSIQDVQQRAETVRSNATRNEERLSENAKTAGDLQADARQSMQQSTDLAKEANAINTLSAELTTSVERFGLRGEEADRDADWLAQEARQGRVPPGDLKAEGGA